MTEPTIPLSWVRELLTSHEAVDRIASVVEGRPSSVPLRDALAHALPFLGGVLEDRAARMNQSQRREP